MSNFLLPQNKDHFIEKWFLFCGILSRVAVTRTATVWAAVLPGETVLPGEAVLPREAVLSGEAVLLREAVIGTTADCYDWTSEFIKAIFIPVFELRIIFLPWSEIVGHDVHLLKVVWAMRLHLQNIHICKTWCISKVGLIRLRVIIHILAI